MEEYIILFGFLAKKLKNADDLFAIRFIKAIELATKRRAEILRGFCIEGEEEGKDE